MAFFEKQAPKIKISGPRSSADVDITAKSCQQIKNQILTFKGVGFRWKTVEVFWSPMNNEELMNAMKGRDFTQQSSSGNGNEDNSSFLEPARPPDSLMGLPQWRYCVWV